MKVIVYARTRLTQDTLAWLAIVAVAVLAPFQPIRPLVDGQASDLRTAPALGFLATALWLTHLYLARRRPRLPWPLTPALALFLTIAWLSALLAPSDRGEALKFTVRLMLGAGVCLATADLATTARRRWTLVVSLVIAATVVGLLGLGEFSAIGPVLSFLAQFKVQPSQVGELVRVSSTFIYTTITSMYLELVIPLAVGLLWHTWQSGRQLAGLATLAALVILGQAMILTFTRSGLLALVVALLIMMAGAWRWRWRASAAQAAGVGVGLAGLVGVTALLTPTLGLRLSTENDRAWYGAEYAAAPLPPLAAGEVVTATVRITNTGRLAWRSTDLRPFNLSYHWLAHNEDAIAEWEGARAALPAVVEPGESVTLQIPVVAPPHSGPFRLGWDMVQDYVTWFSAKAVPMGLTQVEVLPRRVKPAVEPPPILLQPMPRDSAVDLSPSRRVLWGVALDMLRDRPWLGVGPDNFRLAYGRYTDQTVWDTGVHANNMYLEMFADMGILGGLAFLLLTAAVVWTAWRGVVDASSDRILALAGGASLSTWLIHGLFDYFYAFLPLALVYWAILGLVACLTLPVSSQETV